jgi:hypothetical protein
MDKACSRNGKDMNAYRIMVGKTGGRRPLEDLDVDRRIRNKNNTYIYIFLTNLFVYMYLYVLFLILFGNGTFASSSLVMKNT